VTAAREEGAGFLACSNGRVQPRKTTARMLYAYSGGVCARCRESLFATADSKPVTIADMAHIIAASPEGPRGSGALSEDQRAEFENLMLLCPSCHRLVDQAPESYPASILRRWKDEVQDRVISAVAIQKFRTRAQVRATILPMLRTNRAIWAKYGPDVRTHDDPAGDGASIWRRKVRETILPNNMLVLAALDINTELLQSDELDIVEELRMHVDDLTARHLNGVIEAGGSRFPVRIDILVAQLDEQ
jgi:hypothetical protein